MMELGINEEKGTKNEIIQDQLKSCWKWKGFPAPGIILKDAFEELQLGVENTGESQGKGLINFILKEMNRSIVMTDLIFEIFQKRHDNPITLYCGMIYFD
jgi:hypothetical protein